MWDDGIQYVTIVNGLLLYKLCLGFIKKDVHFTKFLKIRRQAHSGLDLKPLSGPTSALLSSFTTMLPVASRRCLPVHVNCE